MKLVLRSLVLVALVAAGWLAWLRSSGSEANSAAARPAVVELMQRPATPAEARATQAPQLGDKTERVETAVAAPEPIEAATRPIATATIRVSVVAMESNEPLAGLQVYAIANLGLQTLTLRSGAGSRAAPGESALSDSTGRVELEVEAGKPHSVYESTHVHVLGVSVDVAALEAGATVEIVLRIPTWADSSFFGRVVDARTRAPIASARFRVDESHQRKSTTSRGERVEPNGEFELRYRSWEDKFVRVEAEGYAWAVAPLAKEHTTRTAALEIPLARSATLEVLVLDAARPLADATALAATEANRLSISTGRGSFYFGDAPQWTGKSGADGVARVVDLAPNVPLRFEVAHQGRKKSLGEPLTLEPGETRRIEIRFGAGATIRGRVETSCGAPLADVEVWRVAARLRSRTLFDFRHKPVSTARSDASGQFTFEDVAEGVWSIGVAPNGSEQRRAQPEKPHQLAPVAELVVVTGTEAVVDVVVRTDDGLFLSGRTLDSSGSVASCSVLAYSLDSAVFVSGRSTDDGMFRVGPLPGGEYRVRASAIGGGGSGARDSASEELRAIAGASDLELRLLPGASLSASLIGPDGAAIDGDLWLEGIAPHPFASMAATRNGRGRFDGLTSGTYFLGASTSSGLFASRSPIVVRIGAATEEVELRLAPGAILELMYAGPEPVETYSVFVDGVRIASNGIDKGTSARFVAPTGAVEVRRLEREGRAPEVHRLTLGAGERRQLVVGQ